MLIIVLFAALVYYFYRSTKILLKINYGWNGYENSTPNRYHFPILIGYWDIKGRNVENQPPGGNWERRMLQTITERFWK
jgi:hypothetical protein